MFGNKFQMNTEAGTECARSSSCASFENNNDNFSADGKIILSAVLFIAVVVSLVSLVLVQSVGLIISVALVVRLITVIIATNKTQHRVEGVKSLI